MRIENIKYIVMDMDGTLLNDKHEIMPKTIKALIHLQNQGYKLLLASGRPLKAMLPYAEELEITSHEGYIIASNGAMLYDCDKKEVVFENRISIEDAKRVFAHLEQFEIYPFFRDEDKMYVEDVYSAVVDTQSNFGVCNCYQLEARLGGFLLRELRSLKEDLHIPVLKIMASGDPDYIDEHLSKFDEGLKDIIYCARTAKFALEFIKVGTSKGNTLEKLGIKPEDILAFGDSMNDKEMIAYAKYGVAMGNAMDEIKEIAFEATTSNNEEGIYNFLVKHNFVR